jgi:N-acetylglucosamine repressor
MQKSITPDQIRTTNRTLIYQYIYSRGTVSQRELIYELHLSRPTVASNLGDLEEMGMIQKSGQIENEFAGRKPAAYTVVDDYKVGIGVEVTKEAVQIACVNLYGKISKKQVLHIPYEYNNAYIEGLCLHILDFIASLHKTDDHILGIGFVFPALVSTDGTELTYAKVLDCTGLHISQFQKHLRFPCSFLHDTISSALTELWYTPGLESACCILLGQHIGAAVIRNKDIVFGKHGHCATIEHMIADPEGEVCYCGNRGCYETLCSIEALMRGSDETPDRFFEQVRENNSKEAEQWSAYLASLSELIRTLQLVHDTDFVLGGKLAHYLNEEDIDRLYSLIEDTASFEVPRDYLRISRTPDTGIVIGGALIYIKDFLDAIDESA